MENRQRVLQAANTISNDAKTWPVIQSLIHMQSKIGCQQRTNSMKALCIQ